MDFSQSMNVAFAGMAAESTRIRIVAQNIANADSTAQTPGGEPYHRQVVTFKNVLDKTQGINLVKVGGVSDAAGPFGRRFDPGHPAADGDGYVLTANVNPLSELMDMRDAQKNYQANLNVIGAAQSMLSRTIDLLRA
jgi:flagellar basal-body rod protein FlgC